MFGGTAAVLEAAGLFFVSAFLFLLPADFVFLILSATEEVFLHFRFFFFLKALAFRSSERIDLMVPGTVESFFCQPSHQVVY